MSETKTKAEVIEEAKEFLQKSSRNQIIELLVKESTGGKSRFSSDQLEFWGGTEDSLKKQIDKIVEQNEKFQTVADFIDHAIEMQLIWWGEKPELLDKRLPELVSTEAQKRYFADYNAKIEQQLREKLAIKQDENFDELTSNILKCHTGKFEYNESIVEKNLMYDTYPLLWKYYSRLLPIKATLHIINYIAQKNDKTYFEISNKNIELAFKLLTNIGDILNKYDELGTKLQRNEKLSTGFPVQENGEDLEQAKKNAAKIETIKNRFKTHTIGKKSTKRVFDGIKENIDKNQPITDERMYQEFTDTDLSRLITACNNLEGPAIREIKPKARDWNEMATAFDYSVTISKDKIANNTGAFQGALNALDLVIPYYDEEEDKTKIFISKKGYEFLKLENPILGKLGTIAEITKEMEEGKEHEKTLHNTKFSREEIHFIIRELIPTKLSLEYKIILRIISALSKESKLNPNQVERIIVETCIDWAYEYPDVFLSQKIDDDVAQYYNMVWEGDAHKGVEPDWMKISSEISNKEIVAWRMATMGRLGEMGIIDWQMGDNHGKAEYTQGKNFDAVDNLPELTREQIIDSRKDYQKILQGNYREEDGKIEPDSNESIDVLYSDPTGYADEASGYTDWARKKNDL